MEKNQTVAEIHLKYNPLSSLSSVDLFPCFCGLEQLSHKLGELDAASLFKVLHFFFFYFNFWSHWAACEILVPRPRIESVPPAVRAWSLNHWSTREVPVFTFQTLLCVYYHWITGYLSLRPYYAPQVLVEKRSLTAPLPIALWKITCEFQH